MKPHLDDYRSTTGAGGARNSGGASASPAPTDRQLEVLRFIAAFSTEHRYPPTLRDICTALGFASTNAAADHIRSLERKGLISRDSMLSRSIVLTDHGRALLGSFARHEHPNKCSCSHVVNVAPRERHAEATCR